MSELITSNTQSEETTRKYRCEIFKPSECDALMYYQVLAGVATFGAGFGVAAFAAPLVTTPAG